MIPSTSTDITLQAATVSDAAALFPIFNTAETVQFTNFRTFEDVRSFGQFLEKFLAIEKGSPLQYGPFCICVGKEIIGLCGIQQISLEAGKAELWYLLHKNYWGQGIAKKAVLLMLEAAKQNNQLTHLYAEAVGSNIASWRILTSLGFIKTGEIPNGFNKGTTVANLHTYSLKLPV